MPEGPSIVLLKEEAAKFAGKKVISVSGNSKIEQNRLLNKKISSFKSWGKHFLICFKSFTVRVHFLMWGTYRIDEKKEQPVRLSITFNNGEINLYSCSIKILEGDVNTYYDWSSDVMNDVWDAKKARAKLKSIPDKLVCDALLEQDVFSGVGNIIKNEVLYRVRVHPESLVGKIPALKIKKMIEEARNYSFEFLEWKRNFELKSHWLVNTKKICVRCNLPIIKKYTGIKNRRSFFCESCQTLYK
ncbi:MAG TPA: DNA-formamidopyrimidine glycosylase family protein [Bacteroidia bacterium]|jgi:endonuclease-8|nr:DNA-formamidopyrimidine glycosylase family protein [Bacteroidia bacterium]